MWWIRVMLLIMVIPTGLYYWALGKNVSDAEEKNNRDMSYELNPFTGEKMPVETKKKVKK
ncbi:hypothetical protein [Carnobacterium sp. TMP28]|uniref:hypothetical protein n=1 Tax=Carnobacterium sp. TMP28 TaxID=3397060 RepID=UPI0039E0143A